MHGVPHWELNLKSLDANKWKVREEKQCKKVLKRTSENVYSMQLKN